MDVQKKRTQFYRVSSRFILVLFLSSFLLLEVSCIEGNSKSESNLTNTESGNNNVKIDDRDITTSVIELLAKKEEAFTSIQEALNSINTDNILKVDYNNAEIPVLKQSQKDKMLNQVENIRSQFDYYESELERLKRELNNSQGNNSRLYRYIASLEESNRSLRQALREKEKRINELIVIKNSMLAKNNELTLELKSKDSVLKVVTKKVELYELELSKKYLYMVSRNNSKVKEVINNLIALPYREREIEILSDQPKSSYIIKENSKNLTYIEIKNPELFWRNGNNVIVKIREKRI